MASKKAPKKPYYTLSKKDLNYLEDLINTPSPTGFEHRGQQVWMDWIKPYVDEITVDAYGTAVATINPEKEYTVVIEAHCDEITRFVNYVSDDGIIYVIPNGGADAMVAPGMRVILEGKKGDVDGVFGRPAIHTRRGGGTDTLKSEQKTIFVDIGAQDAEEVEKMGVVVGSVVRFDEKFAVLNKKYYIGRAFDNRAGGFMIAQVAKLLHDNKVDLPFRLHIVNSVQEEIGLRGAQMIANRLKPDVAIVTDVCHDTTTPHINKIKEGNTKCGKGPCLTVGPAVHNVLRDFIEDVADANKIPFQRMAASYYTGTDTDAFAYSNGGVPSALISLPLKYMHTPVETVHHDDIANAAALIYETVCAIEAGQAFTYFPGVKKA